MGPRPLTKLRCSACRRRKIKCDYQRPTCSPCKTSKLHCEVYQRGFTFVSQVFPTNNHVLAPQGPSLGCMRLPSAQTLTNHQQIDRRLYRTSAYDHFLANYLPSYAGLETHHSSWVIVVAGRRHGCAPLEIAASALGVLIRGHAHADAAMTMDSTNFYQKALDKVRSETLLLPGDGWLDVLVTVMVLQVYEMLSPTFPYWQGCIIHSVGLAVIIQAAGLLMFRDPGLSKIFFYCRRCLIATSIVEELQSFLSEPAWLTLPWEDGVKDDFNMLLDIISQIPRAFLLSKPIQQLQNPQNSNWSEHIFDLEQVVLSIDESLDNWFSAVTQRRPDLRFGSKPGEHLPLKDIHMIVFYCMAKLLIGDVIDRVLKAGLPGTEMVRMFERHEKQRQLLDMADRIVSSTPICLQRDKGLVGVKYIILPLRTAANFYHSCKLMAQVDCCRYYLVQMTARGFSAF